MLSLITKSLAAYSLSNVKVWKQLHTDETERRRTSLVNVVMTLLDNNDNLKTTCLSGSIIAEDKSSEEQSRSVISYFDEAGRLLKRWRDKTAEMYPNEPELLGQLPVPKYVTVTRLICGMVSHDNFHGANKAGTLLADEIIEKGKEEGMDDEDIHIYQGHCFNHLRNVCFEKNETFLEKNLDSHLKNDLDLIPPHICVSCKMSDLLWQRDKEFSGCCNYVKGSGHNFLYY